MAIHVALIGAGNISDTHARAAASIPGVAIAGVYAPTREHAQREAIEDLLDVRDLRGVPVHQVLAAGLAQVDKPEAELARRDLARVAEVLGDLVGENREIEGSRSRRGAPGRGRSRRAEPREEGTS